MLVRLLNILKIILISKVLMINDDDIFQWYKWFRNYIIDVVARSCNDSPEIVSINSDCKKAGYKMENILF